MKGRKDEPSHFSELGKKLLTSKTICGEDLKLCSFTKQYLILTSSLNL